MLQGASGIGIFFSFPANKIIKSVQEIKQFRIATDYINSLYMLNYNTRSSILTDKLSLIRGPPSIFQGWILEPVGGRGVEGKNFLTEFNYLYWSIFFLPDLL